MFELYILILQCVTLITGLLCLWRKGPVLLWIVFGITLLSAINENILVIYAGGWWGISTNNLYNTYAFIDMTAWCSIFYISFKSHRSLKNVTMLFWIGLMTLKILETFQNGLRQLALHSLILFCAGSILLAICYFNTALKLAYRDLRKDSSFWICCASLCFHSVLLINLLTVSDNQYWNDRFSTLTFDILQIIAMTFYNVFICIAFIFSSYKARSNSSLIL